MGLQRQMGAAHLALWITVWVFRVGQDGEFGPKRDPNLLNQVPGPYNSPKGLAAAVIFNCALPEPLGYGKQEMILRKMLVAAGSPHT